jgi:hypothetical protein
MAAITTEPRTTSAPDSSVNQSPYHIDEPLRKKDANGYAKGTAVPGERLEATPSKPRIFIIGLGHQYAPFRFRQDKLESLVKKWMPVDTPR